MDPRHIGKPARGRVLWAVTAAGLIAVTAVIMSSVAGATPFIPTVPGKASPIQVHATVQLGGMREFPVLYAAVGTSSPGCHVGVLACQGGSNGHEFTITKEVDANTPILAQSAAWSKTLYSSAVITLRSPSTKSPLFTYTLTDVRVADDHQVFEATGGAEATGTVKELVTLTYTKIHWEAATAGASVKRGWDFSTNTPF